MKDKEDNTLSAQLREIRTNPDKEFECLCLIQHRARPLNEKAFRRILPGETYKQKGIDLLEVLGSGRCTLDIKAKTPNSRKRYIGESGMITSRDAKMTDPVIALTQRIDRLIEVIEKKK